MFETQFSSSGQMLLIALVILFVKHFLADYPLQTKYQLRKNKPKGWTWPLLQHCLYHAALTLVGMLFILSPADAVRIAVLDFAAHLAIDYWKSRTKQHNIFKKEFWTKHGLDQLFHEISYVCLAFLACILAAN